MNLAAARGVISSKNEIPEKHQLDLWWSFYIASETFVGIHGRSPTGIPGKLLEEFPL